MQRSIRRMVAGVAMAGLIGVNGSAGVTAADEPLAFEVVVGRETNWFVQGRQGAFHVVASSAPQVRLVVASPAGNTGAALWFGGTKPLQVEPPRLAGVETVALALTFAEPARLTAAVVGSIRTIRDVRHLKHLPREWADDVLARLPEDSVLARRLRAWCEPRWIVDEDGRRARRVVEGLAGRHRYTIELQTVHGRFAVEAAAARGNGADRPGTTVHDPAGEALRVPAGPVELTYRSTQQPLTPFALDELLTADAVETLHRLPAEQRRQVDELVQGLRFLAYRQKFLAGSWRFLTYFGRDTLISLRLMAPVLRPEAIEAGLAAVAARLDERGEVAHEESLACQAARERLEAWVRGGAAGPPPSDDELAEPVYDRKMVDDVYLVLPLLLDYWHVGGRRLFRPGTDGFDGLLRNVDLVLRDGAAGKLVAIEPNGHVGDWRDSNEGLGWGTVPFSVNAVHLPAALAAFSGLLAVSAWRRGDLTAAAERLALPSLARTLREPSWFDRYRDFWLERWRRFVVKLPASERARRLAEHRRFVGIPADDGPRRGEPPYARGFLALSLDDRGRAVPVIQGDTSLMALDLPLSNEGLALALAPFATAFPDGLFSPAGVLVASSALAPDDGLRALFDRSRYHGEVVWGWPQLAVHIALLRRLGRWTTPPPREWQSFLRAGDDADVADLERRVAALRRSLSSMASNELWTWKLGPEADGRPTVLPVPYGQDAAAATESNAAQLWSAAAVGLELWLARPEELQRPRTPRR